MAWSPHRNGSLLRWEESQVELKIRLPPGTPLQAGQQIRSNPAIRAARIRKSRGASRPTGSLSFFPLKGRVERHSAWGKIIGTNIPARLGRPMNTVHSNVFPFDGQRAPVADVIERDD